MRSTIIAIGLLASTALVSAASAQTTNNNNNAASSAPAASSATTTTATKSHSDQWRASKLIGLDIYNEQNEKLGDISEILLDKTGKVEGIVIGVGGFLGVGTRDIKVSMDKLKFVDEPVRTSSSSSTRAPGAASGSSAPTTSTASNTNATMSDARSSSSSTSSTSKQWYPDHAILSGASKDQLKSMPEFKYD